jgi:S-adenosylmethionine hydrolase
VVLGRNATPSATFHGRDVFAPAAARLALGLPFEELGPVISDLTLLPFPRLELVDGGVRGEVLVSDRFGNLVTSIGTLQSDEHRWHLLPWLPTCPPSDLPSSGLFAELENGAAVPFARTYGDVPPGSPLAYVGSDGLLEIGVNRGRAADLFPLAPGALVTLLSITPAPG